MRRPVVRQHWQQRAVPKARSIRSRQRIGLLGGSFNPAHDGHRSLSLSALRVLQLDEVWWLVSPQNPLKSAKDMASLEARMQEAKDVARHPQIRISDIETRLNTRFTYDVINRLTMMPDKTFIWLMGADNLVQFPQWKRWQDIVKRVPIAVFDRAPYTKNALSSRAAAWMRRYRVEEHQFSRLIDMKPPSWGFIRMQRHPESSTAIRLQRAQADLRAKFTEMPGERSS